MSPVQAPLVGNSRTSSRATTHATASTTTRTTAHGTRVATSRTRRHVSVPAASHASVPAATIDPAVEPLRRANPHRYRDVRPGHLAVVAGSGRPWFIGRVCDVIPRPWGRTPGFVRVINVDSGDVERIPAPWIVELMSDRGLA